MATTLRDMMRKRLETIDDSASVQDTAKKMKDKDVSSLIVVDRDGKPQGLVTERDLVTKVCVNDTFTSTITNKEIMSVPLITIDSTSTPAIAADTMLRYNVRHLLVTDDKNNSDKSDPKHFIGIITPLDFARFSSDLKQGKALVIKPYRFDFHLDKMIVIHHDSLQMIIHL